MWGGPRADPLVCGRRPRRPGGERAPRASRQLDFILDAVSAEHDINSYINLLGLDGNLTLAGAPAKPLGVSAFGLIMGRRSLSGSNIGGIPETQEMRDLCGASKYPPAEPEAFRLLAP